MNMKSVLYFLESSFSRDDSFIEELKSDIDTDYNKLGEFITSEFSSINISDLEKYESQIVKLRHIRSQLRKILEDI